MKCAYCSAEWKPNGAVVVHGETCCPMSGCSVPAPVAQSINNTVDRAFMHSRVRAISDVAKVTNRMPEDCMYFKNCSQAIQVLVSENEPAVRVCCCPCSQWKKEEKP